MEEFVVALGFVRAWRPKTVLFEITDGDMSPGLYSLPWKHCRVEAGAGSMSIVRIPKWLAGRLKEVLG